MLLCRSLGTFFENWFFSPGFLFFSVCVSFKWWSTYHQNVTVFQYVSCHVNTLGTEKFYKTSSLPFRFVWLVYLSEKCCSKSPAKKGKSYLDFHPCSLHGCCLWRKMVKIQERNGCWWWHCSFLTGWWCPAIKFTWASLTKRVSRKIECALANHHLYFFHVLRYRRRAREEKISRERFPSHFGGYPVVCGAEREYISGLRWNVGRTPLSQLSCSSESL